MFKLNYILLLIIPIFSYAFDNAIVPINDIKNDNQNIKVDNNFDQFGVASWYGGKFHGRRTASAEIFNQNELTAAHKSLPFNTYVEVTNLDNNKTVIVKINDRGPFAKNRIIDLSRAAAQKLDFIGKGSTNVRIKVISFGNPNINR